MYQISVEFKQKSISTKEPFSLKFWGFFTFLLDLAYCVVLPAYKYITDLDKTLSMVWLSDKMYVLMHFYRDS